MARERRATLRVGGGDDAASREAHNRADRAVFGGQRGGARSGAGPGRDLQLGRRDAAGAAARETNESRTRVAARYLVKMTGLSYAQMDRLVRRFSYSH